MGARQPTDAGLWTLPNLITLVRLGFLPVFVWLLVIRSDQVAAAWVLGALGATDWIDGYIARRYDQRSEFGAKFDPTVDRVLFIVALVTILAVGAIPVWFALAILVREIVVGASVAIATLAFGMKRFDVTFLGKTATLLLMFAIPALLLASSSWGPTRVFELIGWALGLPGLALSYWTGIGYFPKIREGIRAARLPAA
jgi:cardiolipin synthase